MLANNYVVLKIRYTVTVEWIINEITVLRRKVHSFDKRKPEANLSEN